MNIIFWQAPVLRAADEAILIFGVWSLSLSTFWWRIAFEIGDEGRDHQRFIIRTFLEHVTLERYVSILVVGAPKKWGSENVPDRCFDIRCYGMERE